MIDARKDLRSSNIRFRLVYSAVGAGQPETRQNAETMISFGVIAKITTERSHLHNASETYSENKVSSSEGGLESRTSYSVSSALK